MKLFFVQAYHPRSRCSWQENYVLMAEDEKTAISVTEKELELPLYAKRNHYGDDFFEIKEIENPTKPYMVKDTSD